MTALFFSRAPWKEDIYEGRAEGRVIHSVLRARHPQFRIQVSQTLTGLLLELWGSRNWNPRQWIFVCAKCLFSPGEIFSGFFFRFLKGISTPHPTPQFKNYSVNTVLNEAAPLGRPSLSRPLWNCFAELLFGVICNLILRSH